MGQECSEAASSVAISTVIHICFVFRAHQQHCQLQEEFLKGEYGCFENWTETNNSFCRPLASYSDANRLQPQQSKLNLNQYPERE